MLLSQLIIDQAGMPGYPTLVSICFPLPCLAFQRRAVPPFVPVTTSAGDTQNFELYPDDEAVDEVVKGDKWSNVKKLSPSKAAVFNPSDFLVF